MTWAAAESQISVASMPRCWSSHIVSRAPCRSGRVSSAKTCGRLPRRASSKITASAVPSPLPETSAPALQWVRMPAPAAIGQQVGAVAGDGSTHVAVLSVDGAGFGEQAGRQIGGRSTPQLPDASGRGPRRDSPPWGATWPGSRTLPRRYAHFVRRGRRHRPPRRRSPARRARSTAESPAKLPRRCGTRDTPLPPAAASDPAAPDDRRRRLAIATVRIPACRPLAVEPRAVRQSKRLGDGLVGHFAGIDVDRAGDRLELAGGGVDAALGDLQHPAAASRCTGRRCWCGRRRPACWSRSSAPLRRRCTSDRCATWAGWWRCSRPGRWPRR